MMQCRLSYLKERPIQITYDEINVRTTAGHRQELRNRPRWSELWHRLHGDDRIWPGGLVCAAGACVRVSESAY
jgi:hypothetical protein